ncbi:MAG: hypothetical protein AAGF93_21050 [Cyanobacteria bacterium P01_H01_bin.105]
MVQRSECRSAYGQDDVADDDSVVGEVDKIAVLALSEGAGIGGVSLGGYGGLGGCDLCKIERNTTAVARATTTITDAPY